MECRCDCRQEIISLLASLDEKNKLIEQLKAQLKEKAQKFPETRNFNGKEKSKKEALSKADIGRYSRQLILPELGVTGQLAVCNASVLVVGCGGLGCPAAIYLAASGIGRLGLVDYDEVEVSNLHRQVLHTEAGVGMQKASSVAQACNRYDVVVDATDNVATRYLLNDACVLLGKPLVSGSALRFEGQLTVYNYKGGPCYRCLFPEPPPPHTVTNCSDGGVLGAVPGVIGVLQATEVVKIVAGLGGVMTQRLLLYDALDGAMRCIKLRPRQTMCRVCGDTPTVTQLIDYTEFCGASASDKDDSITLLSHEDRVTAQEYAAVLHSKQEHLLLDVRQPVEMDICKLPHHPINIAMDKLLAPQSQEDLAANIYGSPSDDLPGAAIPTVYVVCRRGNDSQRAVQLLQSKLGDLGVKFKDIKGGLHAWAATVDNDFPVY